MRTKIPAEFIAAYKQHEMTIYDISERIGKSPSTVYHALAEDGVDTGAHRRRKKHRNEELVGAYQTGNGTLEEVGSLFGISKERVRQIIEREAPEVLRRRSTK